MSDTLLSVVTSAGSVAATLGCVQLWLKTRARLEERRLSIAASASQRSETREDTGQIRVQALLTDELREWRTRHDALELRLDAERNECDKRIDAIVDRVTNVEKVLTERPSEMRDTNPDRPLPPSVPKPPRLPR